MYKNTGSKIVSAANIIAGISVFISLLVGIPIGIFVELFSRPGIGFLVGVVVIAIGSLLAWVLNMVLAGIGELVLNTSRILVYVESFMPNQEAPPLNQASDPDIIARNMSKELNNEKNNDQENKEALYRNLMRKIEIVKKSRDPAQWEEVRLTLIKLGSYNDSQSILRDMFTPSKTKTLLGSLIRCPLCGKSQNPDYKMCYHCGVGFNKE